ncbi:TolC family protein [Legionella saoudiensis]|uniref:TolC family protein n=1 Tax=Legionella saoudiensis TaxID=1750561 RepID=UPI000730AEC5|nr:TolC family protein [Legionella saoudiensis]
MKQTIIICTLLIMLLEGCCKNCGVNEQITYPNSTRTGIRYMQNKAELNQIAWWKKINDPQLDHLIVQALQTNDSIKGSYATIEQAQAQLKAAQYAWIPTFDASASGFTGGTWNSHITPSSQLANNQFFAHFPRPRFRGYYAGFVPNYTVNVLNNISNIKVAKASLAIQQAQAQSTKLSIISQMSGTYFMLLSQREQLAVERALTRDLKKLRQLEQVRFQKGASDLETLTSIDQQLAQEETKIPQIEGIIAQSENTIQLLLNQNPGPVNTQRSLLALKVNHIIPKQLPSSVLKNRPDIMIATNNVKMSYAQIGVAYAEFFPTISLTGLVGNASVDLTNLLKISTNLWVTQAIASMKVLNPSAYQNIKSAKAGFKATYYNYLETLRAAFADVDDALTNEQKNKLAYLQTKRGYLAAKRSYALALAQYKSGARDYRNVVNAKINLERSKLSLIQEKAQLLDAIGQVYTAVAGGYDVV